MQARGRSAVPSNTADVILDASPYGVWLSESGTVTVTATGGSLNVRLQPNESTAHNGKTEPVQLTGSWTDEGLPSEAQEQQPNYVSKSTQVPDFSENTKHAAAGITLEFSGTITEAVPTEATTSTTQPVAARPCPGGIRS